MFQRLTGRQRGGRGLERGDREGFKFVLIGSHRHRAAAGGLTGSGGSHVDWLGMRL